MINTAPKLCTKTGPYGRMDGWKSLERQRKGQAGQGFSKQSSPESFVSTLLRWFLWPYLEVCVPSKSGQHRWTLIKIDNHLNAEQKKWTAPERPDGLNTSTEFRLMQEKCHFVTLRNCEKFKGADSPLPTLKDFLLYFFPSC